MPALSLYAPSASNAFADIDGVATYPGPMAVPPFRTASASLEARASGEKAVPAALRLVANR